jgi:hypothetical protein
VNTRTTPSILEVMTHGSSKTASGRKHSGTDVNGKKKKKNQPSPEANENEVTRNVHEEDREGGRGENSNGLENMSLELMMERYNEMQG